MTQWIAETLIATTLLMLFVLAIRPWVASRFGARVAYFLWFAPALRMILPPLPADWFGDRGAAVQDVVVVLAGASSPSLQPAITTGGGTAWLIASLTIWLGGAVLFFGRHWLSYIRFSYDVAKQGRALFAAGNIPVTASPAVSSPIALGVFGKSVIVPDDFEHRYDAAEQRLAVAHELTHHDRHDVPVNFAALAVLSLHWWNPVAHIAHRAFRLDQEAACDAIVLKGATAEERHAYGSALFKSAMGRVPLAACAMGATTTLKARLRRIVSGQGDTRLARPGAALTAFLVLGGIAVTASGGVPDVAEPAFDAPRVLVLGSGTVETPELVNISTPLAHDEKNCPDARAHTVAQIRAKAIKSAVRARADAEQSRGEVLLAETEAWTESQDVIAKARASAQEAIVEAHANVREAVADAENAMRSAEAARAAALRSITISCSNKEDGSIIAFDGADGVPKPMRIMVCGEEARMDRVQMIKALQKTRHEIAHDPMLPAQTRAHVLAALDRQIASTWQLPAPALQ